MEGLDHILQSTEVVQMVRIHVQDHCHVRIQLQKGVHKFTGLTYHDITFAGSAAAPDTGQLASDEGGQIHPGGKQNLRRHGGGGSLSVGAADADGVVILGGDDAQQFTALQHRYAAGFGSDQLRIVRHNGCGVDDQIRPRNILCPLPQHHRDPQLPDSLQGLGFVVVRPGEIIAPAVENLRQGIHTGAPDSDKVNVFFSI